MAKMDTIGKNWKQFDKILHNLRTAGARTMHARTEEESRILVVYRDLIPHPTLKED